MPDSARRRYRTVWTVSLCFALLVGTGLLAGILAWQGARADEVVLENWRIRRATNRVLFGLVSAETAQRGFLLTRSAGFLGAYTSAAAASLEALDQLRETIHDNLRRRDQLTDVARLGTAKMDELGSTIALAQAGRFDAAIAIVNTDDGRAIMDSLRGRLQAIVGEVDAEIEQAAAAQQTTTGLLALAIVAGLASAAALAALQLRESARHFGLLAAREAQLRKLAETLEQRVARRTRALAEANERFELALHLSGITVMTQDTDLRFTYVSNNGLGLLPGEIIGKTQEEVTPGPAMAAVGELKRSVIASGKPIRRELNLGRGGPDWWVDIAVQPLTDEAGGITGILAGAIDITRYKKQEAHIRLLMQELAHRSNNLLAVIEAVMRQTAANSTGLDDFAPRFSERLRSLAGTHRLLVQQDGHIAAIDALVRSQLGHLIDRFDSQIELDGPELYLQHVAAQHIGMALHELATNAVKYGALSTPIGRVLIAWNVEGTGEAGLCHIAWQESGGPPVTPPQRRGFGRVVIERTAGRALGGDVTIDYAPGGLRWELAFPASFLAER
jgi:PAS domain S-box-containing protein